MSKEQTKDLLKFLKPFSGDITTIVLWLRDFIWDLYPQTNELIYDNYNAVAVGWSPTDRVGHIFCTIAVGRTSHDHILLGEGNQYRYILVKDIGQFPKAYIKKLMKEAYNNSLAKVKDPKQIHTGQTITKSVSAKKRTTKSTAKKKAAKKKK
jgi:hypothetical protein